MRPLDPKFQGSINPGNEHHTSARGSQGELRVRRIEAGLTDRAAMARRLAISTRTGRGLWQWHMQQCGVENSSMQCAGCTWIRVRQLIDCDWQRWAMGHRVCTSTAVKGDGASQNRSAVESPQLHAGAAAARRMRAATAAMGQCGCTLNARASTARAGGDASCRFGADASGGGVGCGSEAATSNGGPWATDSAGCRPSLRPRRSAVQAENRSTVESPQLHAVAAAARRLRAATAAMGQCVCTLNARASTAGAGGDARGSEIGYVTQ